MITKITDTTYQLVCDKCHEALTNPFVVTGKQPMQNQRIMCKACVDELEGQLIVLEQPNGKRDTSGSVVGLLIMSGFLLIGGYASGSVISMIMAVFLLGIANVLMGWGNNERTGI